LHVEGTGISYSLAEVGEQLAWLGAALQLSQEEDVTWCAPLVEITTIGEQSVENPEALGQLAGHLSRICFHYNVEKESPAERLDSGSCWRNLFRSPVVVKGYPIPRRPALNTGVEVSLDIMAGLANVRRVVDFCGMTFLKGFSAMFVATRVIRDVVHWHLFFNDNGHYISYSDPRVPRSLDSSSRLSYHTLETSRHILGWCVNVKNYTGK
jgi:hypothetical protein